VRRPGVLSQPTCSLVGLGTLLLGTPGDFVVLFHGDPDCVNPFLQVFPHRLAPDAADVYVGSNRFFHTGLREVDVVAGSGRDRLMAAVEAIVASLHPPTIFVIGTCLSEMIGEDLVEMAADASERFGVTVVGLPAGGLRLRTQPEVLDRFGTLMLRHGAPALPSSGHAALAASTPSLPSQESAGPEALPGTESAVPEALPGTESAVPEAQPGTVFVSLLGYPGLRPWERADLEAPLAAAGIQLAAELPGRASMDDWARAGQSALGDKQPASRSALTVVADEALWPGVCGLLRDRGQTVLPLAAPVGLSATEVFVTTIAGHFGRGDLVREEIARRRERAARDLAAIAGPLAGLHAAYCIGSNKNYVAGQLAREGLGDLPALIELGMKVEILVQERRDPESLRRVADNLAAVGVGGLPFATFNDPGVLGERLKSGSFALAVCQDHLKGQADRAGVRYVRMGALRPGFSGMVTNARTLLAAFQEGFQARYRRYMGR